VKCPWSIKSQKGNVRPIVSFEPCPSERGEEGAGESVESRGDMLLNSQGHLPGPDQSELENKNQNLTKNKASTVM
jgi:hypothetical protein